MNKYLLTNTQNIVENSHTHTPQKCTMKMKIDFQVYQCSLRGSIDFFQYIHAYPYR